MNQPKTDSTAFIGQEVSVKIDRPLGSVHPKHQNIVYGVNYGYIPNTLSGDGEELDAYVLGVKNPIETFEGLCIGLLRRTAEVDDKLIVVPTELAMKHAPALPFTEEEIRAAVAFQEKFFESEFIQA